MTLPFKARRLAPILAAWAAVAATCALAPAPAPVTALRDTAEKNAETFDAVWVITRDTHWDPTLGGIDWDAVRNELRPAAEKAANVGELRAVISQMLARLGQSHFAILPGEFLLEADEGEEEDASTEGAAPVDPANPANPADPAAPTADEKPAPEKPAPKPRRPSSHGGDTGASLLPLPSPEDAATHEAVIVRVTDGSSAHAAGLVPGTVVLTIGGKSIMRSLPTGDGLERYERAATVRARATGEPGTTATWRVRALDGTERDVELTYAEDTRPRLAFGNLPPFPVALESGQVAPELAAKHGAAGQSIGRIAFSGWFIPIALPFNKAIDDLRASDGLVLDLRGNPGGLGGMAMGIAGHFTPTSERLGTMYSRGGELNFITNPRTVNAKGETVSVYTGPVAILVDNTTASTSEIFAGGMQYLGRAQVFGQRTAGAALPALMDALPNGDVFLHAIADYRLPDGRQLEAAGVKPDNERSYTRIDYARDGDPVMADAIRWIGSQRGRESSSKSPNTKE